MKIPSPQKVGLPAKFQEWRPGQEQAIQAFLSKKSRFTGVAQPTGSGKSASYLTASLLQRRVTVILTSTKALQDQLLTDFSSLGLVDVRGQGSFKCEVEPSTSVEYGPCKMSSYACESKKFSGDTGPTCEYYRRIWEAKRNPIVVTNYFWWFTHNAHFEDTTWHLGEIDALIMDEAHNALSNLFTFLQVKVDTKKLTRLVGFEPPADSSPVDKWRVWAATALDVVAKKLKNTADESTTADHSIFNPMKMDRLKDLYSAKRDLTELSEMSGEWHVDRRENDLTFDPVIPGQGQMHKLLFGDAKRVYATSATLCPETLKTWKLDEFNFIEGGEGFPVERRPVIHVNTLRVDFKTPRRDMEETWVGRIDDVIKARTDRKGIIHTISYDRADIIRDHSKYRNMMYFHKAWNLADAVEAFKTTHVPAIIVSPALVAGYDFPYEECQYQIIGKIPFPNTSSPAMKARMKSHRKLADYLAMQALVQMAGRGMRAPDDYCETIILDDHFIWWYPRHKKMAPKWFQDSVKLGLVTVPKPKYRLEGRVLPKTMNEERYYVAV